MSLKQKFNSLQRIAYDNNFSEQQSERSDALQSNCSNSQTTVGINHVNPFWSGVHTNQKHISASSQQSLINPANMKNSTSYSMVNEQSNSQLQQEQTKQASQQYSGLNFDGYSYCNQSQHHIDKIKLFERISISIDQLSECVLDYLNTSTAQAKQTIQQHAKPYSKQEINSVKNLLHATVGNFLVETVKFNDPMNKENQRGNNSNYIANGYSHNQSNNEYDDMSTHIHTSKNTFTNRPLSSNQPSQFFTEYQPDEYVLHQEIEKLNDIINQMQSEKEWMEHQMQELQYEDIFTLKQERQTFEEIKGDLADYISNFKKSFLSVQFNCQKASDIVQSDLFNEFYDILTTTENNWNISKFSKNIKTHFKDDMRFFNLRWKQKKSEQVEVCQLKKRSNSLDFKIKKEYKTSDIKKQVIGDLNEQIIEKQQQISQVKCEKEIEFSIFHTFLRQFTQNSIVESLENKACIQDQQDIIEKQQQILVQIQQEQALQDQSLLTQEKNLIDKKEFQNVNQDTKSNIMRLQQEQGDDSPMFSKNEQSSHNNNNQQDIQKLDQSNEDDINCNFGMDDKEEEEENNNFGKAKRNNNNFRKSSEFNSMRRQNISTKQNYREQDDKAVFTLNNDDTQVYELGEQTQNINKNKTQKDCRSIDSLMDLPLQIYGMKQSRNSLDNSTLARNQLINMQTNNMNFTIGNDQSDFLLQNVDPSFNQEINNISCINKLEDEPQQIINFLETLEQKPTSRFMCQSSFKKQKIAQNLNLNNYNKQSHRESDQTNQKEQIFNNEDQYTEYNDEFIHLDQIKINNRNGIPPQFSRNRPNYYNSEDQLQEPLMQSSLRQQTLNGIKNKKPILMSFNNKEDIINNCQQDEEEDIKKSKIESFMNENFDDVNNSLNLEDIEQIEELCQSNINQETQQRNIKHLKNIDLPKLDLSTINCTEQLKNVRMTIGQNFMNNQSLQGLQISSCKSQANQFANPQSLFNMISPIHNAQQGNIRQQNFIGKKAAHLLPPQPIQDNQANMQTAYAQQNAKLNESVLNQTYTNPNNNTYLNNNPNNNTQIELLKGLNDTVLNQMEKIEIERSNFYSNYQNLLNEKNDILQREIILKNTIIDLQREVQSLTEENCRLHSEIEQQQKHIEQEMNIIKRENENIKNRKEKLRQAKEQLSFRKKQQEDKEKLVGQQQLMNMLQEKKIIFQKQSLDQQWSEQDKKKVDLERLEKLLSDEWENVKKETKKISEFISKQKLIKDNLSKELQKEKQIILQQKEEITAQHKILKQKENDFKDQESELKEREKKKEEMVANQLKIVKQKEEGVREKENIIKEKEKQKYQQVNKEIEEKYNQVYQKEQEQRERDKLTKIALQEAIANKNKYSEELKRLKQYDENLNLKEQELTNLKYEIMSEKMKFQEQQDKIKQDRSKFKGMIPNLKTLANKMSDYEDNGSEVTSSQSSRSNSIVRLKKY